MSGISSWLWGTPQIDDAVDKATSEMLPAGAEDIALNLEICDQIRSKSAPANYAMRALKRRLNHKNPNVQLLALGLTDICVKNGGDHFLVEVASREFMDNLVSILKIPVLNHDVKTSILRLVQNWSVAFEGKPSLGYVGQVYKTLTSEGFRFPPKDLTAASSAMVDTQTAPEWIDSELCLRCRTPFSFTNRKHHCRNCGQVFDHQCSTKSIPLPHFGITQDVRVCDGCHAKLSKKAEKKSSHRHSTGSRHKSARDLADEELQRAIQMSLQEASGRGGGGHRPGYVPSQPTDWQVSEPPIVDRGTHPRSRSAPTDEEDDPDLRAAIEASLREANAPKASAPMGLETPRVEHPPFQYGGYSQSYPPNAVPIPNYDLHPVESDAIRTFTQTVQHAQQQGARDMSRYPAVNELYDMANSLRPKLEMSMDDAGKKEQMLTEMHDKMSQIVRLYDNLLTEQQVAHPQWQPPSAAHTGLQYQPANSSYSTGHNTMNGYAQWQPSQQSQQYGAQPPYPQQYAASPPPQQQWYQHQQPATQYGQTAAHQQQVAGPSTYQQPQSPEPFQPYGAPAPSTLQHQPQSPDPQSHSAHAPPAMYQQPSAPYSEPPSQYQAYQSPTPVPTSEPSHSHSQYQAYQSSAPASAPEPQPSQYQAYQAPAAEPPTQHYQGYQPHAAAPPPPGLSPVSEPQHSPPTPQSHHEPQYASRSPQAQFASAPGMLSRNNTVSYTSPAPAAPAPFVSAPPPAPAMLSRNHTISYTNTAPAPTTENTVLSRSNTVSHAPAPGLHAQPHQQQTYHRQQEQQQPAHYLHHQVASPPPQAIQQQLPSFPAAPTAAPIPQYNMYSAPQQPERKEALLIDL